MTTATRTAWRPRWALAFLAAVLAVAAALLGAAPASAATACTAQNAVGAATSTAGLVVGPSAGVVAGQRLGNDLPRAKIVVATGVAAETAGSIRAVNPLGGGMNCVNCAVATDATLAGSPASALLSGPKPISVLEQIYGGSFKPVSGQAEIAGLLTEAGNGARGIVYGSRSGGVGHVFNAVNQGRTIRFLDGQTGGAASFSGFDSFMFLGTN